MALFIVCNLLGKKKKQIEGFLGPCSLTGGHSSAGVYFDSVGAIFKNNKTLIRSYAQLPY